MERLPTLPGLVANGRAVDLILVIMAVEFAVLSLRRRARRRQVVMMDLFFALAPGALILLALRAALMHAGWLWIAIFLAASFPIHMVDLIRRRL